MVFKPLLVIKIKYLDINISTTKLNREIKHITAAQDTLRLFLPQFLKSGNAPIVSANGLLYPNNRGINETRNIIKNQHSYL